MVGIVIRDGTNTPRTLTAIIVRDGTNTPRTIAEMWIRDLNNVPRLVFNPSGSATLAVSLSADSVFGRSHGTGTATTTSVTATASGGTAPYTYAWTLDSTDFSPNATATSPAAAATTFTQTGMAPDDFATTSWIITVTDANGVSVAGTVGAYFSDFSGLIDTR